MWFERQETVHLPRALTVSGRVGKAGRKLLWVGR